MTDSHILKSLAALPLEHISFISIFPHDVWILPMVRSYSWRGRL
jgi:hypothetical protein